VPSSSTYLPLKLKEGKRQLTEDEAIEGILKRRDINSWLKFADKIGFKVDMRKCDYSNTGNGVKLWNQLSEFILNRKLDITQKSIDTDASAFAQMVKRCKMTHGGVVIGMLAYICYKRNTSDITRDDMYISRMSTMLQNIHHSDTSYFIRETYNGMIEKIS